MDNQEQNTEIAQASTAEVWSSLFEKEKKRWQDDYAARREELDVRWQQEQEELRLAAAAEGSAEWKRLTRTDKERFLDDFKFEIANQKVTISQGIANAKETVGFTLWDAVSNIYLSSTARSLYFNAQSIVLSHFLEQRHKTKGIFLPEGNKRKTVVEMGGGCGMVRITPFT